MNYALAAIYVPLVAFSLSAMWLYSRHIIWPAFLTKSLSTREHGMAIGMVFMCAADLGENVYYGMGRLSPELYAQLSWSLPHVSALKVVLMLGSMFVISSYWQAVYGRGIMWRLTSIAVALWIIAYSLIVAFA